MAKVNVEMVDFLESIRDELEEIKDKVLDIYVKKFQGEMPEKPDWIDEDEDLKYFGRVTDAFEDFLDDEGTLIAIIENVYFYACLYGLDTKEYHQIIEDRKRGA